MLTRSRQPTLRGRGNRCQLVEPCFAYGGELILPLGRGRELVGNELADDRLELPNDERLLSCCCSETA